VKCGKGADATRQGRKAIAAVGREQAAEAELIERVRRARDNGGSGFSVVKPTDECRHPAHNLRIRIESKPAHAIGVVRNKPQVGNTTGEQARVGFFHRREGAAALAPLDDLAQPFLIVGQIGKDR